MIYQDTTSTKPQKKHSKFSTILAGLVFVAAAVLTGVGINLALTTDDDGNTTIKAKVLEKSEIDYANKEVPTKIETAEGDIEIIEAPTVEFVDSDLVTKCEDDKECGKGTYAPVSTPQDFYDFVIDKCINEDSLWGAQCWDLAQLFWTNYASRNFSTCGTGAAKGAWNCKELNAGDEFELITDTHDLQAGDWIIFTNGIYGHVGMALGEYNKGYIALLGQNQGGKGCSGGGSSANVINISLTSFAGAFRPKTYIKPKPSPTPVSPTDTKDTCETITLKKGDTLGSIMKRCEGEVKWGAAMKEYALSWVDVETGVRVFDGWTSKRGIGLYYGHTIKRVTQ